jgi:hypothetical protein
MFFSPGIDGIVVPLPFGVIILDVHKHRKVFVHHFKLNKCFIRYQLFIQFLPLFCSLLYFRLFPDEVISLLSYSRNFIHSSHLARFSWLDDALL